MSRCMSGGVLGDSCRASSLSRHVAAHFFLVAFSCLAPLSCAPDAPDAPQRPPNLVLISLDDLGAVHVGAYGSPRDTTPFLDQLARGGVLFESAHAQATWTLPSHASMLSSRHVGGHGVYRVERRFPEGPALLPEVLRDAGWQTAAFTSCDFISELYGLDRGFDHMQTAAEPAQRITARMAEYMLEHEDGPFFLFLHYYDVHQPFTEPNPYGVDFSEGLPEDKLDEAWKIVDLLGRDPEELSEDEITWLAGLFPEQDIRGHIENARREGTLFDERLMKFVYRYLAEQGGEALEARAARYDNGVANMDMRLSELFEVLELFPWYEDTVFVITSDHGESFNEPAGIMGHGGPPYREQTHVPLIVFGRGIPAGVRVTSPVASIDIAPTLLDLAGVQVPEEFQGLSLAAALQGGEVDERPILSGELQAGSVAVRTDEWTLLVGDNGSENKLFDVREASRLDLSDQHPDIVEQLRGWLRGAEARNAVLTSGLDPSDVLLDEEARARLKELGYLR